MQMLPVRFVPWVLGALLCFACRPAHFVAGGAQGATSIRPDDRCAVMVDFSRVGPPARKIPLKGANCEVSKGESQECPTITILGPISDRNVAKLLREVRKIDDKLVLQVRAVDYQAEVITGHACPIRMCPGGRGSYYDFCLRDGRWRLLRKGVWNS